MSLLWGSLECVGHYVIANGVQPAKSSKATIMKTPAQHSIATLHSMLLFFCRGDDRLLLNVLSNFFYHCGTIESYVTQRYNVHVDAISSNQFGTYCKQSSSRIVRSNKRDYCDVHRDMVGACLSNVTNIGKPIVSCMLRTLIVHERWHSVGEREALTFFVTCEKWHTYVWGR